MARDGKWLDQSTSRTLSALLRQMFETISNKPTPPELLDLVDQLDTPPEAQDDQTSASRILVCA